GSPGRTGRTSWISFRLCRVSCSIFRNDRSYEAKRSENPEALFLRRLIVRILTARGCGLARGLRFHIDETYLGSLRDVGIGIGRDRFIIKHARGLVVGALVEIKIRDLHFALG